MKKKIVLSGIFYPVAILRYFETALQNRSDIELITVGVYTGSWIPWNNGMELPEKYAKSPTIALNKNMWTVGKMPAGFLAEHELLGDADLWIQCDAGFYFTTRPPAKQVVHIATDPHVLDYDFQRGMADKFFNMQRYYSKPGDIYLPYAASLNHHYPYRSFTEENDPTYKPYDVAIVGLNYPVRNSLANRLKGMGLNVMHTLGLGMDEYREAHVNSKVVVSWSSLQDLIARVFEAGAMRLPLVTNYVPDLTEHFVPTEDLRLFHNEEEAVRQVMWCLENPKLANEMAGRMHDKVVEKHTYDHRIQQIFEEVGLYA